MAKTLGAVAVIAVLVTANLLNNRLAPEVYIPTSITTAIALIAIARRCGCTWADLGLERAWVTRGLRWAGVLAGVVLAAYVVAILVPTTRELFLDRRVIHLGLSAVLFDALIRVPLGTILLEETAFRGVVYGFAWRRHGVVWATIASSVLFGLWHILPARHITSVNPAVAEVFGGSAIGHLTGYALAVIATALVGVVLCELRRRSRSLVTTMGLHWATNGFGYLAAYAVVSYGG